MVVFHSYVSLPEGVIPQNLESWSPVAFLAEVAYGASPWGPYPPYAMGRAPPGDYGRGLSTPSHHPF